MIFKWLTVPFSNRTRQIKVVQLWEVRWQSTHERYPMDSKPEIEAFPSEEAANEFALALRNAFKLVRQTTQTDVEIIKSKSV